jgi:hypothetical protein
MSGVEHLSALETDEVNLRVSIDDDEVDDKKNSVILEKSINLLFVIFLENTP